MKPCQSRKIQAADAVVDSNAGVAFTPSLRKSSKPFAAMAALLGFVPFAADAIPAFNWDFKTYYPHAETQLASLSIVEQAAIDKFDVTSNYTLAMYNATGAGLTQAELDEVAAMPAYFTSRAIVVDGGGQTEHPDLSVPASFSGDFVTRVTRLTDLYKKASPAQAAPLEQVYSTLIEYFLDQNYLPGGTPIEKLPLGNGYSWDERGWKTLRMMHKLTPQLRDLYSLSFSYISGFSQLMEDDAFTSTDRIVNYYPSANQCLALMTDTPAKWQLMKLVRRGLDLAITGKEGDPQSMIVPLDGSIIHHGGHHVSYADYSYKPALTMEINWSAAGINSPYTANTIDRLRKGALAWCFATTGGLNPLHQNMRMELEASTTLGDGGAGDGPAFALQAAQLTNAYYGTPIADDLEMAYAAIAKRGVGNASLPAEWKTITPPANIDPNSPLYTASLRGIYAHNTNGTAIFRSTTPTTDQWYASLRGQQTDWRGGESYDDMGLPTHFNLKALHGSMMLITTGKGGRKPNEVDSGYFYNGWDYSYYPNVTCPEIPLVSLLDSSQPAYFGGESNLMGSANLRDSGVWMVKVNAAYKSAFMLGNRIVLVSNNINGSNLHTGLIQMGHTSPATEPLVLDGATNTGDGDWTLTAGGNHKIVDGQNNGYFIHQVAGTPAIKARRASQSVTYAFPNSWKGNGTAPPYANRTAFLANLDNLNPTTANFSKVWFDHGASATNQALEYTVLIKPQPGELDNYATAMASPATAPVAVSKTPKVHRFQDRATGTTAVAAFDASETLNMGDVISVNRPGAYIWRNDNDLLRLSVSSSDNLDTSAFRVTLNGSWVIDSQTDTYNVSATSAGGNTVVSLSYRQASPQNLVLRRTAANSTPTWTSPSITKPIALIDTAYSVSVAGDVSDVDAGDTRTFSKIAGPAWLAVAANGALSGTPAIPDVGNSSFSIRVTDALGASADATVTIVVSAGNATWTNPAGGSWIAGGNWSGGIIASGADTSADFSTLNLTVNAAVTLDGARTIGQLKFGDTTASNDWTLNTGSGGPLTLATTSGSPEISVNNQTATLALVLAGTNGINKTGAGTLVLSSNNTYTGATTIDGGKLVFGTGASTNVYTGGQININNGSTMQVAQVGTSNRYDFGARTFNFGATGGGRITTAGATTNWVSQGTWTFKTNGGAKNSIDGTVGMNLNGKSVVLDVSRGSDAASDLDIAIVVGNSAGTLTKSGDGIAMLSAVNTYTGATIINGGTLQLGNGTLNPTINSTYAIGDGATLLLLYNTSGGAAPTWSKYTGAGTLALGSGKNIDSSWSTAALGAIFTGTLQVERGRANTAATADGGLGGATSIVVQNGAQLGMWNGGAFSQNFTIAGVGYGEGNGWNGALRFGDSGKTTTLNGTVTLAGNTTLVARTGGFGVITGNIGESTASSLTIGDTSAVAGTITLSGINTYAGGTELMYGTLRINAVSGLGSGYIAIKNNATLQYDGTGAESTTRLVRADVGAWNVNVSQATGSLTLSPSSGNRTQNLTKSGVGTFVMDGVISGGATVTSNGGTLTLSGTNTHTGLTTVYDASGTSVLKLANPSGTAISGNVFIGKPSIGSGTLLLGANNQLSTSSLVTFDHAFGSQHAYFKLNGFSTSIAGLQNGGADLGGEVINGATASSFLTLAGAGSYTFGPTNGYHGTISNGSTGTLGIVKTGSGTQTFTGANTYTGTTTIEAGTLAITGSLGTTAVEVKGSAKLTAGGNFGGAVTIRSTGHLAFALATTPGGQPARTIGGALTLDTGNILDLTAIATPAAGTYVLANTASINGTPGTLNLPAGVNGTVAVVGNSLRLTIPAPGYAAWIAGYNLASQTDSDADADQDGLPNAIEFVLGTDPTHASGSGITTQSSGENLVLTFHRDDASEGQGLRVFVEAGVSPASWSQMFEVADTDANSSAGVAISENGANADTVVVTIPTGGASKLFARLKVVLAGP